MLLLLLPLLLLLLLLLTSKPEPVLRRRRRSRRLSIVFPKLNIAVLSQGPLFDKLALLAHEVLYGKGAVAEDVEVVGDDVAVAAAGAGDENGAAVVALLGDVVGGLGVAGRAGEAEAVVRLGLDARSWGPRWL